MKLSRSQKRKLYEILGAAALLIAAAILSAIFKPIWWAAILLYLPAFVLAGHETITSALRNILRGQVFDEHFLMTVASIAAMILGEHAEAVGVLLFVACGLCTSVMWGATFNLAVEGLGKYTSIASGLFMVMVCGGGILPLLQGAVADAAGYIQSYWVLVAALAYTLWFALSGSKTK